MNVPDRRPRLPAAATAAKLNGSSPYHGATNYSLKRVKMWTCENCGESGMTTFIHRCPQCQHLLCKNCATYSPKSIWHKKYRAVTRLDDVLEKGCLPNSFLPQSSPKAPLLSSGPASSTFKQGDQEFKNLNADEGIATLPSAETSDLNIASDIRLSSSYSTPSLEANLTTIHIQESNISSGTFSNQDYTDSETELETDDTNSSEVMTDDEDTIEAFDYAIDILDSRLFSVLGHDPELASRLIPQIHAQLQLGFEIEDGVYRASPSHGSKGAPETHGDLSMSSFTSGSGSSHNGLPRNTRGRERDESKDHGDESGPKRRRRFRDRSAVPRRRYACHFHKKDPARYCPLNDPKFNICLGRGNPQLRRMKEHYLKAHRPSQCERCYTIFKDRDELKDHRQAESTCHTQPNILKEGIDDSQWAKIEPLFHVRRKLSTSQKEQDDFDKWFEIWDILFPNVTRPPNPWVNIIPMSSNPPLNDAESLLTNFNSIIELDVERGVLQHDDNVHQRYERAFRLALQTHAAVSAPTVSLGTSTPEMNEPGNDSAERLPETQTTVETLRNSLTQLVSSQSTPQNLPNPYQDHSSPRLETQLAPSSLWQFDVTVGTYVLQPSNESMSQISNVSNASNVFESPLDSRGTLTTEPHLTGPSSTHYQLEVMSRNQETVWPWTTSNTGQTLDFSEILGGSEFTVGSYHDSCQDDYMPFNTNHFEHSEEQLTSDLLTNILESENDAQGHIS